MPYDLKKAATAVGVMPKNFSVYHGTKSQVLIGSGAPTANQLAEVQKTVGNQKAVLKGVCFRKLTGTLIFATKAEPPSTANAIVMAAMKAAGYTDKWKLRQLQVGEGDADSVDGEASASEDSGSEEKKVLQPRISPSQGITPTPRLGTVRQAQPNIGQGTGQQGVPMVAKGQTNVVRVQPIPVRVQGKIDPPKRVTGIPVGGIPIRVQGQGNQQGTTNPQGTTNLRAPNLQPRPKGAINTGGQVNPGIQPNVGQGQQPLQGQDTGQPPVYHAPRQPLPRQVPMNPGQGQVNPGQGQVNPGQGQVNPGQGQVNPGQGQVNPGQGQVNPGQGQVNPGQGQVNQPRPAFKRAQVPVNPGQRQVNPGQGQVNPGQGQVNPGQGQVNPGQVPVNPGQVPVNPGQGQVNPGQVPVNPGQGQGNQPRPALRRAQAKILDPQGQVNPGQGQVNPGQVPVNPGQVPVNPGQVPVQPQVIPVAPRRAIPEIPAKQNVDGLRTVVGRADEALQQAKALTDAVAQSSFQPGSAVGAAQQFAAKPVATDRRVLADFNEEIEDFYGKYLSSATEKQKNEREAAVKLEKDACAKLDKTMKDIGEGDDPEQHLDALEAACQQSITAYNKRFKSRLQNIDRKIETSSNTDVGRAEAQAAAEEKQEMLNGPQGSRLLASIDALLETKLLKSKQLVEDLGDALLDTENDKSEANVARVQAMATEYRKLFTEHADHYKKVPGRDRPKAVVDQEKFVDGILEQADLTLFSLKDARLGPPPWVGDNKKREGNDLIDKGREITARNVLRTGSVFHPSGGTSEVLVLKNASDQVEFAFKTAQGETSQMGLPPGSGAIREAVTSRVMDAVLEQTGFDFGFPKATIAIIEGKPGALIEGIRGRELPSVEKIKLKSAEKKKAIAEFQNKVPGKQLQKTICAGFITGNFMDQKWDNVFWEGEGDAAVARPFDAGAAFLPTAEIKNGLNKVGSKKPGFDVPLLFDANGKHTKGAKQKLDQELIDAMLAIDLKALEKSIDDEIQRHAASGLDQFLDVESKKNGLKSLAAAQKVLSVPKKKLPANLVDFVKEMEKELVVQFLNT